MKAVDFDRGKEERLAASLEQELSDCRVLGETNRPVESICGLRCLREPLQQVSANRPVGLIARDGLQIDRVQYCQPRFRSVRFGYRRGVSGSRAERRGYADQLFVEEQIAAHSVRPLRARSACTD